MRKIYNEFFYIPKHGKIREKVMLTRIVMTITIMVVCLAAMSFTAYAYFSYNVTSGSNIIKTANFETKVSIKITDENDAAVEINPITSNYKTFVTEELEVGKYYTVTIEPTDNSTAKTGFVVVTADGCNNTYHTQQIGVDENVKGGKTPSISFKLMITDKTKVEFLAHWGTSAYYDTYKNKGVNEELYITQNEGIKLIINEVVDPVVNTDKESENTTSTTDNTSTPSTEKTESAEATPPETTETSEQTSTTKQTQPTTANTENTGTPTTEANEQ